MSGDQKRNNEHAYLVMGLAFIAIGIILLSSSRAAGICFLVLGCVWLGLSMGAQAPSVTRVIAAVAPPR